MLTPCREHVHAAPIAIRLPVARAGPGSPRLLDWRNGNRTRHAARYGLPTYRRRPADDIQTGMWLVRLASVCAAIAQ
jgi:hypothetical protein